MENFCWGEIGAYGGGILRSAPTPRIDSLADEGLKLLNFNVESQRVPSRSAIMTGRYAIRSGTSKVPLGAGEYGMTRWEYMMSETSQRFPGVNGFDNTVKNKDGSIDIYFGPTKPKGAPDSNWIQTIKDRGLLVALRCYGTGIGFFDQTWKPGDVVKSK
jgi:hypothetical protein